MYTYNVSKNHLSVFLGLRFQFYFMDLKKKCFEIVVITYNGKKGTELKIFEYFGINVIQIFDQI